MRAMRTLRLLVDPGQTTEAQRESALRQAAAIVRAGGTVAFPTETVYGLGANALDATAVEAIFQAKQRPAWDPLIVHISDQSMLAGLVRGVPQLAQKLINALWPGPLTMLLPRAVVVPDAVTAGRSLVGVRMPAHDVALELIRRAGVPIAAPSANLFGHISPTTAGHVLEDLDGRIDAVLDGGPTAFGLESTVLDATASPVVVYRPGAVTIGQVREIAGAAEFFARLPAQAAVGAEEREGLPAPGVGLRHYAPRGRLVLVEGGAELSLVHEKLRRELTYVRGEKVGILWPGTLPAPPLAAGVEHVGLFAWGCWTDGEELARRLFAGLRELDAEGCAVILCPVPSDSGIGAAIRDRLFKASYR